MAWSQTINNPSITFVMDGQSESWSNIAATATEADLTISSDTAWISITNQIAYDGSTQTNNIRLALSASGTNDGGDYLVLEPGQETKIITGDSPTIRYRSDSGTVNIFVREIAH